MVYKIEGELSSSAAVCQQTGTAVGRTPGSAAPTGITVTRVIPKSTCETMPSVAGGEVAHVPEMWFGRSWDDLVCVRHTDGRTEQINADLPHGVSSADEVRLLTGIRKSMNCTFSWWQAIPTCLSKVCRARICGIVLVQERAHSFLFSNWCESSGNPIV